MILLLLIGLGVPLTIYIVTNSFSQAILGYVIYLFIKFIRGRIFLKKLIKDDTNTTVNKAIKSGQIRSYLSSAVIAFIVISFFLCITRCNNY